jgi:hypothetical protein
MDQRRYGLALCIIGLLVGTVTGLAQAQICLTTGNAVYLFDILVAGQDASFGSVTGARIEGADLRPVAGTVLFLTDQQGNPAFEIGLDEQLGAVSTSPHPFATTLMILSSTGTVFIRTAHGGNAPPQPSQGQVALCPQS